MSNASVTFLSKAGSKTDDLYFTTNKRALGDVLQSCTETTDFYYLVVNNSSTIEVVGRNSFKSKASIEGFRSPRYLLDLGNDKALVTNLRIDTGIVPNEIDIVNLKTNEIEGSIAVNNWCEMMVKHGNDVFVANTGRDQILVIDATTLTVTGTIPTPAQPMAMLMDKNDKIWVICNGEFGVSLPSLLRVDANTEAVEKTFEFPVDFFPQRLAINGGGNTLYILSSAVYTMSVSAENLSLSKVANTDVAGVGYALGVDPVSEEIFVGDAKDFSARGMVSRFDRTGNAMGSFECGVAPNAFLFRN